MWKPLHFLFDNEDYVKNQYTDHKEIKGKNTRKKAVLNDFLCIWYILLPTHKNRKQRGKTYNLCLKIPVRKQCCDEEK